MEPGVRRPYLRRCCGNGCVCICWDRCDRFEPPGNFVPTARRWEAAQWHQAFGAGTLIASYRFLLRKPTKNIFQVRERQAPSRRYAGLSCALRSISLIAVDWGTSNFRAFRLDAEGAIVARCSSPQGILRVADGNFAAALHAEVGSWLAEGEKRILMCGMIGSRQGWVEAAYLPCPAGIEDLANAVIQVPFSV